MIKIKKRAPRSSALFLILFASYATADDYVAARQQMVEAFQNDDHAAMVIAAKTGLRARPLYPGGLYNLAFAEVLAGNHAGALDALDELALRKLDFRVEDIEAFAPLKEYPRFSSYLQAIQGARAVVGEASVAWQLDDGHFVPEGIAIIGDTLFLGSIRRGVILRVRGDGAAEALLQSAKVGSIFGMQVLGGDLWFAAADTDQLTSESTHATGLYSLKIASGSLHRQYPLPKTETWQTLGDLVDYRGTWITADQTDGRLYQFDRDTENYSVLIDRGNLRSPQGMVVDGDTLYVADWNGGLFSFDLIERTLKRVAGGEASLYGIDGLYRSGDWLIAIQNGIRPNRVTALRLSSTGDRVVESRILAMNHAAFDEPNLGVVANGAFYFVANSHWNRFDRDHQLPEGLSGPTILRVELPD